MNFYVVVKYYLIVVLDKIIENIRLDFIMFLNLFGNLNFKNLINFLFYFIYVILY